MIKLILLVRGAVQKTYNLSTTGEEGEKPCPLRNINKFLEVQVKNV